MARIAVPLTGDFEDPEFTVPRDRLEANGHELVVIGPDAGDEVEGKRGDARVRVEKRAGEVDPESFDALLIPGGYSPDQLRTDDDTVSFVKRFLATGRPVAAVCHGPQLLIEAEGVKGRTMTSWPSVRKDLENAGAEWVDREVVVDENLISSRKPDDLEAFSKALIEKLSG